VNGEETPPHHTVYYFDRLIDYNDPSKGAFKVRYWATWEYYKPGEPIVLTTPGEVNADGMSPARPYFGVNIKDLRHTCTFLGYSGYPTNQTIHGQIAKREGGATIVVEHRFYGSSYPYPNLSAKNFKVHTLNQAIEDFDHFTKNAKLTFPGGNQVRPDKAPWIFVGGGCSGALASCLKVA